PYELLTGTVPSISYLKPFGCHVTILNTIDHLGKFDGKSDEGLLVRYSNQGKAFRVYNLASKRVEETMNIKFLENKPNIAQTGHKWYFDLDYLTDSMNYSHVRSTNPSVGPSYITTNNATSSSSSMESLDSTSDSSHASPVVADTQANKEELASLERQEQVANEEAENTSTNTVSPGSTPVTPSTPVSPGSTLVSPGSTPVSPGSTPVTSGSTSPGILSAGASSLRYPRPFTFANELTTEVPNFQGIYDNPGSGVFTYSSYDDEEPRADLTNMSSTVNVNPTSTKRINSAHPSSLIIGDIASPV
ncbi:hypothetical protein Tco_1087550, partial [Tanacetum coccineum]